MNRKELVQKAQTIEEVDVLVIGGGASGLGVALDAVSRGYSVICVEKDDFGKGTSSKATKLLHGGVRYLAQGDLFLVYEALRERTTIIENASHVSEILPFIIPIYTRWDALKYYVGLKFYDLLAGGKSLGKSSWLDKETTIKRLPNIKSEKLRGGIEYFDGQFDDSRLCIDVVNTISKQGGVCLNYTRFERFLDEENGFDGIEVYDKINDHHYEIKAKAIVNATGVYFDRIMQKQKSKFKLKIVPSRGSHIILDRSFLNSDDAIMIPKTTDGRVLFIIPWKTVVILGTTDTVTKKIESDPKATEEDIDFILSNAQAYLVRKPQRSDIKSTFAGLRPLASPKNEGQKTKEISRSHKILVNNINLFSLLGGKWTSYRKMGYDTLKKIIMRGVLPYAESTSHQLKIEAPPVFSDNPYIHPDLPYSWEEIEYCINHELVEHAEDVLGRRTRCIFLNKEATLSVLDQVIDRIAEIKQKSNDWIQSEKIHFMKYADTF